METTPQKWPSTLEEIAAVIETDSGVDLAQLRSKAKNRKTADARARFAHLANMACISDPAMGRFLRKNHSTLVFGAHRWVRQLANGPPARKTEPDSRDLEILKTIALSPGITGRRIGETWPANGNGDLVSVRLGRFLRWRMVRVVRDRRRRCRKYQLTEAGKAKVAHMFKNGRWEIP